MLSYIRVYNFFKINACKDFFRTFMWSEDCHIPGVLSNSFRCRRWDISHPSKCVLVRQAGTLYGQGSSKWCFFPYTSIILLISFVSRSVLQRRFSTSGRSAPLSWCPVTLSATCRRRDASLWTATAPCASRVPEGSNSSNKNPRTTINLNPPGCGNCVTLFNIIYH